MMEMGDGGSSEFVISPGRSFLWDELQTSIMNAISSADSFDTLSQALDQLFNLTDAHLCGLLCTIEGIAMIKSNVIVKDGAMRYLFILSLSKLIVRGWICLHSIDSDGFARVESRSEARRQREDFIDMSIDLFKNFAFGCIGKAPGSDPGQSLEDDLDALNSYSEAISFLLKCYNGEENSLYSWVDALMGVNGSGSSHIHHSTDSTRHQIRLNLVPLLRPTMNVIFSDPYLLIARCKLLPSYRNQAVCVVNGFMRLLLNEIRDYSLTGGASDASHFSSFFAILDLTSTKNYQPMFATGRDLDATRESREGDQSLSVVQYVSQWVESFLLYILMDGAVTPSEIQSAVKDVILLCQHRVMIQTREKTSSAVLHRLFYLLETDFSHSQDSLYMQGCEAERGELLSLALLTIRYLPQTTVRSGEVYPSSRYPHLRRSLKLILRMTDRVTQTRLLSEVAVLLLDESIDPTFTVETTDDGSTPSEERYDFAKSSLGRLLADPQVVSRADARHTALLTAVLRTLHNTLSLTASVLAVNLSLDKSEVDNTSLVEEKIEQFVDLELEDVGASRDKLHAAIQQLTRGDGSTSHAYSVCNHELFLSRNRLWRHTLSVISADGSTQDTLSAAERETDTALLIEHLLRLLQAVVFVMKVCGDSFLRWPVSGDLSDSLPSSLLDLLESFAALLLPSSSDNTAADALRRVQVSHKYGGETCSLSHQFCVLLDRQLEALVANSGTKAFVVLCVQPHSMRLSSLLVRHVVAMVTVTGNSDLIQSLLSYLKLLLQQPSHRRRQYLAALQGKSNEGVMGGGRAFTDTSLYSGLAQLDESHPEYDPLGLAHRMHTLTLIAALASQMHNRDASTAASCLKIVREIEQHFYVSSATVSTPELLGVISTAATMRGHIESVIRHITALLPGGADERLSSHGVVTEALQSVARDCDRRLVYEKLLSLNAGLLYEEDNRTAWATPISNNQQLLSSVVQLNGGKLNGVSASTLTQSSLLDLMGGDVPSSVSVTNHSTNLHLASALRALGDIFFDNSDANRVCGMFSTDRRPQVQDAYLSSADVMAVVDDVFHSHMLSLTEDSSSETVISSSSSAHRSSSAVEWSATQFSSGERHWTQVSGSGDVLTVQCSSEVDQRGPSITVHVRVHNGSGFKIPMFSLHLLLQSGGATHSSLSALYDSDSLFKATGAEYFLPDAYLERSFQCAVQSFGSFEATVRVVYPDLSYDEDEDMFEVPVEEDVRGGSGGVKKVVRAKRSAFSSALTAGYHPGYALDGSDRYAAVISCSPLRVSVSALLVPYGAGSLTSLTYWKRRVFGASPHQSRERGRGGVSQDVFQSLWRRLEGTSEQISRKVSGRVSLGDGHSADRGLFLSEAVAHAVTEAVQTALSLSGTEGLHMLGMDGRVSVGLDSTDLRAFVDLPRDRVMTPYLAWGLQTLWGAEVACRLVVERLLSSGDINEPSKPFSNGLIDNAFEENRDEEVPSVEWKGRLEIRSSDGETLGAVVSDLAHFVFALSAGSVHLENGCW